MVDTSNLGSWNGHWSEGFSQVELTLSTLLLGMDVPAGTSLVAMDGLEWGGMGYLYGYLTVMAIYQL